MLAWRGVAAGVRPRRLRQRFEGRCKFGLAGQCRARLQVQCGAALRAGPLCDGAQGAQRGADGPGVVVMFGEVRSEAGGGLGLALGVAQGRCKGLHLFEHRQAGALVIGVAQQIDLFGQQIKGVGVTRRARQGAAKVAERLGVGKQLRRPPGRFAPLRPGQGALTGLFEMLGHPRRLRSGPRQHPGQRPVQGLLACAAHPHHGGAAVEFVTEDVGVLLRRHQPGGLGLLQGGHRVPFAQAADLGELRGAERLAAGRRRLQDPPGALAQPREALVNGRADTRRRQNLGVVQRQFVVGGLPQAADLAQFAALAQVAQGF